MCILVLPSSINLAAKNDQYICAERKGRGKNEEREKKKEKQNTSLEDQVAFPLNMEKN